MRRILAILLSLVLAVSSAPAQAGYPNGFSGNALGGYAGYIRTGGTYSSVQATWRVPAAALDPGKPGVQDLMYQWVGIDGTSKLIQTGIQEIVSATGSVSLIAWYECFPDFNIVAFGNTVRVGDVVTSSITCTANCTANNANQTWTAVVQDVTQNWTATQAGITCATGMNVVYPFVIETGAQDGVNGSILHFGDIPVVNITVNGVAANLATTEELYGFAHGGGSSTATQNPSDPSATLDGLKLCWGQGDTGQAGTSGYTACPNTTSLSNSSGEFGIP